MLPAKSDHWFTQCQRMLLMVHLVSCRDGSVTNHMFPLRIVMSDKRMSDERTTDKRMSDKRMSDKRTSDKRIPVARILNRVLCCLTDCSVTEGR